MTVVLFDIDGTLIRTGRAGSRAMNRAFEEVFGIPRALDGIQMAGRTDKWILDDAASRAGIDLTAARYERFHDRYVSLLPEALAEPVAGKRVLPGVSELLSAIHGRDDVFPAVLTGNCEQGARLKLEHFDLWRFFRCGAYGDAVVDRNELFDVALERAWACGVRPVRPAEVVVIGDTVLDVACAQMAGARSLAVATGTTHAATLRASNADLVVDDLSDTRRVLEFVVGVRT